MAAFCPTTLPKRDHSCGYCKGEQLFDRHHGSILIHAAGARTNHCAQGLRHARQRPGNPARLPVRQLRKVEYWLGAGQLTSCTVDDVRGLQKCVKVVVGGGLHRLPRRTSKAAASARPPKASAAPTSGCRSASWARPRASTRSRPASRRRARAATLWERRSRGVVAARQKARRRVGRHRRGPPRRVQRARQGPEEPRHLRPLGGR